MSKYNPLNINNMANMSDSLQVQLQLYKYLRDEVMESIKMQHRTFLAVGLLITTGFSLAMQAQLKYLILSIVPIIIILISLWLIEQSRLIRVGEYLCILEDKINKSINEPCITWETWIRREGVSTWGVNKILNIAQLLILSTFVVIGYFSTYLIWITPLEGFEPNLQHTIAIVYLILLITVMFLIIRISFHRRQKIFEKDIEDLFEWEEKFRAEKTK